MVNQTVYNYIKANIGKYNLVDLKNEILGSGYTQKEFQEAYNALKLSKTRAGAVKKVTPVSSAPVVHEIWITIGWICMIVLVVFALVNVINFANFAIKMSAALKNPYGVTSSPFKPIINIAPNMPVAIIISLLGFTCLFFVYFAFFKLGNHAKSNTLKYSSFVLLIITIIMCIGVVSMYIWAWNALDQVSEGFVGGSGMTGFVVSDEITLPTITGMATGSSTEMDMMGSIFGSVKLWDFIPMKWKLIFMTIWLTVISMLVAQLFFAIGLIKIKGEVWFAGIAGYTRLGVTLLFIAGDLLITYIVMKSLFDLVFLLKLFQSIGEKWAWYFSWGPLIYSLMLFIPLALELVVLIKAAKKYETRKP